MDVIQNNVIEKQEIDKFKDLNLDKFKDIQKELDAPAQLHKQQKKNGNQTEELATIKKAGEKEILTPEEFKARARELKKCKNDILYFCRKYFKIVSLGKGLVTLDPYPRQAELLKFMQDNRRVIVCAARQCGKTTIYTVYLLWYAMFHPDKRIMICGNKLAIAIEVMDRIRLGYEYLPFGIKLGVKTYNKQCIEFENNSIIRCFATGSSGCRGFSANCVNKYSIIKVRLFGWLKLKLPIFMLRWFGYEQSKERDIEKGWTNKQGMVDGNNQSMSVQLCEDDKGEFILFRLD